MAQTYPKDMIQISAGVDDTTKRGSPRSGSMEGNQDVMIKKV
jgi:hypothetical protein